MLAAAVVLRTTVLEQAVELAAAAQVQLRRVATELTELPTRAVVVAVEANKLVPCKAQAVMAAAALSLSVTQRPVLALAQAEA